MSEFLQQWSSVCGDNKGSMVAVSCNHVDTQTGQQNIPSSSTIPVYWINLLFETIAKMSAALTEVKWGFYVVVAFQTLYARNEE